MLPLSSGIFTRCCNGVTNEKWWESLRITNKPLFFSLKMITSYKNIEPKPVKNIIGRYKTSLEALKSYKSIKAITDFVS
jgi:hypothetical protein